MQSPEQSTLRDRILAAIGNPILLPISRGSQLPIDHPQSDPRFDPHALPDEHLSDSPDTFYKREIQTQNAEDVTRGVKELFDEGAQQLAVCMPFVRAFVSTKMENVAMAAELPCGSWECKKCGPKLKLKWYLRQVGPVIEAPFLEKIYIDKEDWGKTHRAINRAGEKYIKYEQNDGSLLVLTTARLGGLEIKDQDREFELVKALMGTAFTKQPVSQSRNWETKTEVEQPESDPNWQPLDSLRFHNLEELIKELTKMGIKSSPYSIYSRTYGAMRATTFRLPGDVEFWNAIWRLGALARHSPHNGPRESRETKYEWDPAS